MFWQIILKQKSKAHFLKTKTKNGKEKKKNANIVDKIHINNSHTLYSHTSAYNRFTLFPHYNNKIEIILL